MSPTPTRSSVRDARGLRPRLFAAGVMALAGALVSSGVVALGGALAGCASPKDSRASGDAAPYDPVAGEYPQILWMMLVCETPVPFRVDDSGRAVPDGGATSVDKVLEPAPTKVFFETMPQLPGYAMLSAPTVLARPGQDAEIAFGQKDKAGQSTPDVAIRMNGSIAERFVRATGECRRAGGGTWKAISDKPIPRDGALVVAGPLPPKQLGGTSPGWGILVVRASVIGSVQEYPFQRSTSLSSGCALEASEAAVASDDGRAASDDAPRTPDDGAARLATAVAAIRAKAEVPALAVAIVTRDGVRTVVADGVRRRGAADAIAVDDRMHLGSCTKAMTATLAAILVAEGRLRWTSTVPEVLGAKFDSIDASWKETTLDDLLRHRGGAPAHADATAWAQAWACKASSRACREAFVRALLGKPVAQARGSTIYSNQGYAIVGAMLEEASGAEYETLIRERLFAPLGMASAGFGPCPEACGHGAGGAPNDGDNPAAISPAGRVHASLRDWGRFIAMHVSRTPPEGVPLTREDFDRLHAVLDSDGTPGGGEGMASGWLVAQRPWGGRVLTHSGSNTLWFCVAWLAPEKGFAVLAACNQGGDAAVKACDEAAGAAIREHLETGRTRTPPRDAAPVPS